jgi:hypothetical protein
MVSVFSENLRVYNAAQFKESVSEEINNSLYFTIGKPSAWANDASPPQTNTSIAVFNDVYNNMIAAKRIYDSDMHHVTERFDWAANTKYAQYDHCLCSLSLFNGNTNFYVVTDDFNVYKCLANSNSSNSTVKPTSTIYDAAFQTSDGYIWKYMYTISASEQLRFTTSEYIPVKTLSVNDGSLQYLVQQNAIEGGIEAIHITDGGSDYSNANTIIVTITGDGTGAEAIATVNTVNEVVDGISMVNPGVGYTYANVSITTSESGTGEGATAKAIISPPGGHGSDPLRELGASKLIVNPRLLDDEEGKFPVTNDYRQVSIIQDPLVLATSNVSTNTAISQYMTLTLNGTSIDYQEDEIVYQGTSLSTATFSGTVLSWDSANSSIKLTNLSGTPSFDLLVGSTTTAQRFVDSITYPELKKYSGELIYTNNLTPISRSEDQTEDFKIVLKF